MKNNQGVVMSKPQKFFILTGLGVFCICVLTFVMKDFFKRNNSQVHFSTENRISFHKSKLYKCKNGIKEVVNKKRTEYRCRISTRKTHEDANYTVQSLIILSRKTNGEIDIHVSGKLRNPTRHATEADFCEEGCQLENSLHQASDTMEILKEIAALTSDLESHARSAIELAKNGYNQKLQEKQTGLEKAELCLGKWHDRNGGYFEDFSIDKQVDCKFNKLYSIKDPIKRELFYQTVLKQDLWSLAISDTEAKSALRAGLLETITDPYYSSSTKSSASFLAMYLNWKENYDRLTEIEEKNKILNSNQHRSLSVCSSAGPSLCTRRPGFDE